MTAALQVTTPAGATYTHLLAFPLKLEAAPAHRTTRFAVDSLDLSTREVISIGDGRAEFEAMHRFERNPRSFLEIASYAADGEVIYYSPDVSTGTWYPFWLINADQVVQLVRDADRYGFGEYQIPIRFRDASSSGQSLEELFSPWLFRLAGGVFPRLGSFARTGTIGSYVAASRELAQAAANIPRITWREVDGVWRPALLLERGMTNLVTYSDALSNWGSLSSAGVTDAADAWGELSFSKVSDADGGAEEARGLVVSYTGDADKAVAFCVAEPDTAGANGSRLKLRDATAVADRLSLALTWSGGVLTVTPAVGTVFSSEYVGRTAAGKRVYELQCLATGVVAANTNRLELYPAITASELGDIYIGGVRSADVTRPLGSHIPTSGGSAARGAEYAWAPHSPKPQVLTWYARFSELSTTTWPAPGGASPRITHLGRSDDTGARLILYKPQSAATYRFQMFNAAGDSSTADISLSPSRLDEIELCGQVYSDGHVELVGRKNGGSETSDTTSTSIGLPAAWGSESGVTRIAFGSRNASAGQGDIELDQFVEADEILSIDEMAELIG